MLIFNKIMSNLKTMKITFLSFIFFIFFPILSLSANNVELSKNHKKAIAWDCKYNLNDEYDSINDCKNLLVIALKRDGVLFNLNNFKKKKIDKAEKSCSKRIKKGVYHYNACLAEYFDINIEIEVPPTIIAKIENDDDEEDQKKQPEEQPNEQPQEQPKETDKEIILTANDIYNKVVKSSFQVWSTDNINSSNWICGSSVVIKKNQLATNCHVVLKDISNKPYKNIFLVNHKEDASFENKARVIAQDVKNDVCIIESNTIIAPPVKIKKYEDIKMLEKSYVVGGPECKRGVMTSGEIQNKYDRGYDFGVGFNYNVPLLQTNAHIRGGNSGGGLFDKNANLIGITTMTDKTVQHSKNPFNIALSADNFIKLLENK